MPLKSKRARIGEENYYKRTEFRMKNDEKKNFEYVNQDAFNFEAVYSSLEDSFSENLNEKHVQTDSKELRSVGCQTESYLASSKLFCLTI
jgi:hypothetical protein